MRTTVSRFTMATVTMVMCCVLVLQVGAAMINRQSVYESYLWDTRETLQAASDRAANYFASQLDIYGILSVPSAAEDLAAQYKLPTLFLNSGHIAAGQRLLDRIKTDFMQPPTTLPVRWAPDGVMLESRVVLDDDLASHNKLHTLFLIGGHIDAAQRLLDRNKRDFMQCNGDFWSYPGKIDRDRKSSSFFMTHYWTYMNNWIATAAHRVGRFDISIPAFKYSKRFFNPIQKAACVTEAYEAITNVSTMDALSTAHLGLLSLYMGDLNIAIDSGETLLTFMANQPDIKKELSLRMYTTGGVIINDVPNEMAQYYTVVKDAPNQLYFFLGYHGIFMTKLYQATRDARFLESAIEIVDFALGCDESMYTSSYSHKLAYAASLVAVETGKATYMNMAMQIAEYHLSTQTEQGVFVQLFGLDEYDQSPDIAISLREIYWEMDRFVRNLLPLGIPVPLTDDSGNFTSP